MGFLDTKQNRQLFSQSWQNKERITEIHAIRNEKDEITMDFAEIQRIICNYIEKLHSNKMEMLGEMGQFLDTYKLPKLNQEDTIILSKPLSGSEIQEVIQKL